MESGFEHVRGARRIDSLFGWSQLLVTGVGWIFASIFTYLQLQKYSFLTVVQSIQRPNAHPHCVVALLLRLDTGSTSGSSNEPGRVHLRPDCGKIPASLFSLIPILLILGAVLFVVQENERYLSAAFTAFFIIDVVFWLNIVRLARRYEAASARIYEKGGLDARTRATKVLRAILLERDLAIFSLCYIGLYTSSLQYTCPCQTP